MRRFNGSDGSKLITGSGRELKPVIKSFWKNADQQGLYFTFCECPKVNASKYYGLEYDYAERRIEIFTAEVVARALAGEFFDPETGERTVYSPC